MGGDSELSTQRFFLASRKTLKTIVASVSPPPDFDWIVTSKISPSWRKLSSAERIAGQWRKVSKKKQRAEQRKAAKQQKEKAADAMMNLFHGTGEEEEEEQQAAADEGAKGEKDKEDGDEEEIT